MWSVLAILLPVTISALSCSSYMCHAPGVDYGNVCYNETGSNVYMQLCREDGLTYCDVDSGSTLPSNCTAPPTTTVDSLYPGALCTANSQCLSGNCTGAVCQGNSTNQACSDHSDCNPGLYCGASNTCVDQVAVGGACFVDYQCVNSAGCDKPNFSAGKCVAYYSVAVKSQVQYCVGESSEAFSRLCSTGVCTLVTPGQNGVGNCSDLSANVNYTAPCLSDTDCVAKVGTTNQTITGDCQCGYSVSGNAYCNAFSGDPPSVTVLNLYKAHLSNTTALNTCNTLDRFSNDCTSKTLNATAYASLVKNDLLSEDLPAYIDNDYCTQLIINDNYFQETVEDLTCPSWSCAESGYSMATNCLEYLEGKNAVFLTSCSSGLALYGASNTTYCNTGSFYNDIYQTVQCGASPSVIGLTPGSTCYNNTECYSGNCTSKVCVGTKDGKTCTQNQDCDVGLYCTPSQVCSPLIAVGQSGCYSDYECALSASCNIIDATAPGKCQQLFSLTDGVTVPCFYTNGNSTLCASGACIIDDPVTMQGHCTTVPMLKASFPSTCTSNTDCIGQNSKGEVFQGTCKCGFNPSGLSYCTPFPGDAPSAEFLLTYRQISQTNSVDICHTSERFSPSCIQDLAYSKAFNDATAVLQYFNSTSYGDFLNNDKCVQSTVNSYYWNYNPGPTPPQPDPDDHDDTDDDDDFGVTLGVGAVAFAAFA